MSKHNRAYPEIKHDSLSSKRYKEDLDDLWPRIKKLEIELSRLEQIRDAVLNCEGIEMRDYYEVPKDNWEILVNLAIRSLTTN